MRMAIQGIGLSAAFGSGVESLRSALQSGTVAVQEGRVERGGTVDTFPAYRATIEGLDDFFPKRALRRIDHYSKMTLLGASLALKDAGLLDADRSRMGVVIATGYGALKTTFDFLDSYLDFGYSCSSPTHFSNSVHNAAAAHVSMQFKATAPSLTVTQFEMSVPSALLSARQWLAEGRVDQVLFGAIDEYCDVLRYCRKQFFGPGEQGPMRPGDFAAQSAVVGEGAAFMLLGRENAAYGHIDSVVLGNHLAAPVQLPPDDLLVLGADGHRECGRLYAQAVGEREAFAFAPLYGSFPAAVGFDLAVAALALREQKIQAPVGGTVRALTDEKISCLKFGPGGDYGLIGLSR